MSTRTIVIRGEQLAPSAVVRRQSGLQWSEELQQAHYDEIGADYEAHYSDPCSVEYRRKFIYGPMFEGISLPGMNVLDAMCGCGQTTEFLLANQADVVGLDISNEVIQSFRARWTNCKAVRRSLLDSGLPSQSFDCVVVVGGLHHIQPHVAEAITEIHRVLKPEGYFCFMEPHSASLANIVRRFWYKHDELFSDNESAIDLQSLEEQFRPHFRFNRVRYLGNVAFLFVLNSLVFRIPLKLKPLYAPFLMRLEPLINKLQGRLTSCFVVVQWQKNNCL
jgi:SAM-dependent methyltransferase